MNSLLIADIDTGAGRETLRKMQFKPLPEHLLQLVREPQENVSCGCRAGLARHSENFFKHMVGDHRNDGRDENADGDASFMKRPNRLDASVRCGGSRLS